MSVTISQSVVSDSTKGVATKTEIDANSEPQDR